jgi:polyhydroxyalkanoate synthase
VQSAVGNIAHRAMGGRFADFRPLPRTLIDSGRARSVYEYHLPDGVDASGDPVLLVPPLGAPASCFDLRRGCSLVEHMITGGRPTYLLDYGDIGFGERTLGLEHWVDNVLPHAIRAVHKRTGKNVHVVGWCLGGIMSIMAAARMGTWPIASLTAVASPFDYTAMPLISPLRPLFAATSGHPITPLYRAMGSIPSPLVRRAFQLSTLDKQVTKPFVMALNLGDRDYLAQIEAVDRFTSNMAGYPGRTFGQLYHQFIRANEPASGEIMLGGTAVRTDSIKQPTLIIAGQADTLAPAKSVRKLTELLPEAAEVRFETAPGGHLGVIAGRGARTGTWPMIDKFLARHD